MVKVLTTMKRPDGLMSAAVGPIGAAVGDVDRSGRLHRDRAAPAARRTPPRGSGRRRPGRRRAALATMKPSPVSGSIINDSASCGSVGIGQGQRRRGHRAPTPVDRRIDAPQAHRRADRQVVADVGDPDPSVGGRARCPRHRRRTARQVELGAAPRAGRRRGRSAASRRCRCGSTTDPRPATVPVRTAREAAPGLRPATPASPHRAVRRERTRRPSHSPAPTPVIAVVCAPCSHPIGGGPSATGADVPATALPAGTAVITPSSSAVADTAAPSMLSCRHDGSSGSVQLRATSATAPRRAPRTRRSPSGSPTDRSSSSRSARSSNTAPTCR